MSILPNIISLIHTGYIGGQCDYDVFLERRMPDKAFSEEDIKWMEDLINIKSHADYNNFPEDGGIDVAGLLLAEVKRLYKKLEKEPVNEPN